MDLDELIAHARGEGASDLHLEPGLPAAIRVRGSLRTFGEPIPARSLHAFARSIIGEHGWTEFQERRSYDLSKVAAGVRCRINVLGTARGVGLAIRLLSSFQPTLRALNLHPDLERMVQSTHGLVLVSGPTGSGKSSTLAALVQQINASEARHVITLESPIEYDLVPRHALIRQREIGRDTPSFEQGLLDALREDPDVLMVGEMRDPETMRLTLNAAETGHLVLATVHSATAAEALQRVVSAFPAEIQNSVAAQLADCLIGVIAQRLRFRPELKIRVPECEILVSSTAVRAMVRQSQFYKLASALESGGQEGCWTFARYREWLDRRSDWQIPSQEPLPAQPKVEVPERAPLITTSRRPPGRAEAAGRAQAGGAEAADESKTAPEGVLVIPSAEEDLQSIVSELEKKAPKD
jgi:twitching motility protein PilT